jgi:hypothetical protein
VLQRHPGVRRLLGSPNGWTVDGLKRRLAAPKGETHASHPN